MYIYIYPISVIQNKKLYAASTISNAGRQHFWITHSISYVLSKWDCIADKNVPAAYRVSIDSR